MYNPGKCDTEIGSQIIHLKQKKFAISKIKRVIITPINSTNTPATMLSTYKSKTTRRTNSQAAS